MLVDAPNIAGPSREDKPLPERLRSGDSPDEGSAGFPLRRIGLEQEFFLVDRRGAPRELADVFLQGCRQVARAEGLDPHCFKAESVRGLVEIITPPSDGVEEMARHYLSNLGLALGVASELDLALYPLGTYPLPITPALRDDPGYAIKARTIGHRRFSHAGRCAGVHMHLELPAGTVWPDVKGALDAPVPAQRELLGLYNLATALDPALVAITRACPFYEGRWDGVAARTAHYRGILGFDGLYTNLREVGGLSAYAGRVEDLVDQQRARYRAWLKAMDLAGVERRLFAQGFVEPGTPEPPRHRRDQEHGRQLSRDGAGGLRPHPRRRREGQTRGSRGKTAQGDTRPRARRGFASRADLLLLERRTPGRRRHPWGAGSEGRSLCGLRREVRFPVPTESTTHRAARIFGKLQDHRRRDPRVFSHAWCLRNPVSGPLAGTRIVPQAERAGLVAAPKIRRGAT